MQAVKAPGDGRFYARGGFDSPLLLWYQAHERKGFAVLPTSYSVQSTQHAVIDTAKIRSNGPGIGDT